MPGISVEKQGLFWAWSLEPFASRRGVSLTRRGAIRRGSQALRPLWTRAFGYPLPG